MTFTALPQMIWPLSWHRHKVVVVIVFLCCLVEVVLVAADAGLIGSVRWRRLALQNGAFWAGLLDNWQPNYRGQHIAMFASYTLLHAGLTHLIGNVLALLWLGPALSERLGKLRFVALFIGSALGGAIGFMLLSSSPVPMVGASGAIFGLIGAHVALEYRKSRSISTVIWTTLALTLLNLVTLILEGGLLAWQTHLGGYITGALSVFWLTPITHSD